MEAGEASTLALITIILINILAITLIKSLKSRQVEARG
jgi:hypothetical protein